MPETPRTVWLDKPEIGEKIKEIRIRKGLSQLDLAERLGMPQGQAEVSRWERGVRRPGYEKMLEIAKLVGRGVEIFQQGGEFDTVGRHGAREESPEQAARYLLPDVSYLKPTARAYYDRVVGSWFTRHWPIEMIERAAREFVAPIKGYSTLRRTGQGFRELSDDDQVLVLEDQAEEIEAEYGPNGVLRGR